MEEGALISWSEDEVHIHEWEGETEELEEAENVLLLLNILISSDKASIDLCVELIRVRD